MPPTIPTPNYVTMEECELIISGSKEVKHLPVGTFVRPVENRWLPRHITDSAEYDWFIRHKKNTHVYVYCSLGMGYIPNTALRRV